MASFEDQVKQMDIRGIIITSNITALGILLALMWKDVLLETVSELVPASGLTSLYITTIVATVFVVSFAYILLKSQEINRKHIYTFREKMKTSTYKSEMLKELRKRARLSSHPRYKYRPVKRGPFSFK